MQEDKEAIFDAIDTVELCLPVFGAMLDTMTGRPGKTCGGRGRRLHQRYRLRRLSGQEGAALPGSLHDRGPAGQYVHPLGENLETLTLRDFRHLQPVRRRHLRDALELKHCVSERKR